MIPGYMTAWFVLIIVILFATGWKPYIAPKLGTISIVLLTLTIVAAACSGIWWTPLPQLPAVQLHLVAAILLIGSLVAWAGSANRGHRGYLVLCVFMVAIIWGSIRSLYTHDPVLYWLEPGWNSPLLCGLLCCIFTANIRYQSGVLLWSAVLGDVISVWLDNGSRIAIGSASWWDSLSLALGVAYCSTLVIYSVRQSAAAVSRAWIGMRRGRE